MVIVNKNFYRPSDNVMSVIVQSSQINHLRNNLRFYLAMVISEIRSMKNNFLIYDTNKGINQSFIGRVEKKIPGMFNIYDKEKFADRFGKEFYVWCIKNVSAAEKHGLVFDKNKNLIIESEENIALFILK